MILPPSTIGILGSGQLGRMLSFAAKRMGYKVIVYSPSKNTPAGQVSDEEICADYNDLEALHAFAKKVDVVTIEFENIAVEALQELAKHVAVYPSPFVLHTAQNRLREKTFLANAELPVTPFKQIDSAEQLASACDTLGLAAVMKTAGFGYDGKGQAIVKNLAEAQAAYKNLGEGSVILEAFIDYQQELSVVAARNEAGAYIDFGVIENEHENHILATSIAPSSLDKGIQEEARVIAKATLEALDVVGVMCVEFFLTADNVLLINEVAPRPHNSGHLSIEGATCSQFEQQLRAICNLPLGDSSIKQPTAMINLLGNVWQNAEPQWQKILSMPDTHLHLYGKEEARLWRKMGHITLRRSSNELLSEAILNVKKALDIS